MSKRRKESNTLSVWFKEPLSGTNPARVRLNESDVVVDLLETIIQNGYLKEWADPKPNIFNVFHKGEMLPHDTIIKNVQGICITEPLIIEMIDDSKFHC